MVVSCGEDVGEELHSYLKILKQAVLRSWYDFGLPDGYGTQGPGRCQVCLATSEGDITHASDCIVPKLIEENE